MKGSSFLKPVDGRCWWCGSPLEPALNHRGIPTARCSNPNCRTRFSWTDYTPPQPEWKPEPKPATPDITDHDGPCSVSEADWLEFNTEANDYGVPDRAGLQSVIDVIGEHYLHLTREWGWNDTEVRDAMYVETKQRGWCRE